MEWPADSYPDFCKGMIYIMSLQNTLKMLKSFEATMTEFYIWMEDVYITGILPSRNNIEHEDLNKQVILDGYQLKVSKDPNIATQFIAAHVNFLEPKDWIETWHKIFDSKIKL